MRKSISDLRGFGDKVSKHKVAKHMNAQTNYLFRKADLSVKVTSSRKHDNVTNKRCQKDKRDALECEY